MKACAIICIIFAVGVNCETSNQNSELMLDAVMSYFGDYKNVSQDREEVVTLALNAVGEGICIEKKMPNAEEVAKEFMKRLKDLDKETVTICNLIVKKAAHAVEPLTNAIDGCLQKELKGLPPRIIKIIVSVVEKICNMKGEDLVELTNPCILKIDIDKCIDDIYDVLNDVESKNVIKLANTFKDDMCNDFAKGRPCLEKELKEKCKLEQTGAAVMGLADAAFKKPCGL